MKKKIVFFTSICCSLCFLLSFLIYNSVYYFQYSFAVPDSPHAKFYLANAVGFTILSCLCLVFIAIYACSLFKHFKLRKVSIAFAVCFIAVFLVKESIYQLLSYILYYNSVFSLLITIFGLLTVVALCASYFVFVKHTSLNLHKNICLGCISLFTFANITTKIVDAFHNFAIYKDYSINFIGNSEEITELTRNFFTAAANIAIFTAICYCLILALLIAVSAFAYLKINKNKSFKNTFLILIMLLFDIYILSNMGICMFYDFSLAVCIIYPLLILSVSFLFICLITEKNKPAVEEQTSSQEEN